MSKRQRIITLGMVLILAGALAGCAAYKKCGFHGCPGDAEITAKVHALFAQHADLGPPNLIQIETRDRVVYLTGQVATGLQKEIAGSLAAQAPGAARVVNSIAEDYSGR